MHLHPIFLLWSTEKLESGGMSILNIKNDE